MLTFVLLFTIFNIINSYEPSCSSCKFFISNPNNNDLGLCSMFNDKLYLNNGVFLMKNLASHCRNNENLCGKSGFLYEPVSENKETENYEYIKKLYCEEIINDKTLDELEDIEKEMVEVFHKMRRHNTRRIYKSSQELYKRLYKLFKNKEDE